MNYYLDLSCHKSILGNNAIFISWMMSAFLNPLSSFFADRFGRKVTFFLSTILNVLGCALSLIEMSYWPIVVGFGLQITGTFYLVGSEE